MAEYKTAVFKAQTDKPIQSAASWQVGQGVQVAAANIGDEDWAQNDTVKLFRLPPNATIIAVGARYEAFGSSVTLDIGTSSDGDAILDGHAINASGYLEFQPPKVLGQVGGDGDVIAKFLSANPTDDAHIWVTCLYVLGA